MQTRIRSVWYFHATIADAAGAGHDILSELAREGVRLLAFSAVPIGPTHTHLLLFPDDVDRLIPAAQKIGVVLSGPQQAFLVQGGDHIGAIASVHRRLAGAGVPIYATSGVSDGTGSFGYLVYVRPGDIEEAACALGITTVEPRWASAVM